MDLALKYSCIQSKHVLCTSTVVAGLMYMAHVALGNNQNRYSWIILRRVSFVVQVYVVSRFVLELAIYCILI